MRYRSEVKELMNWLKIEGNSSAQLATALGYKSSSTIGKWIKVNKIPLREVNKVLAILRSKDDVPTEHDHTR